MVWYHPAQSFWTPWHYGSVVSFVFEGFGHLSADQQLGVGGWCCSEGEFCPGWSQPPCLPSNFCSVSLQIQMNELSRVPVGLFDSRRGLGMRLFLEAGRCPGGCSGGVPAGAPQAEQRCWQHTGCGSLLEPAPASTCQQLQLGACQAACKSHLLSLGEGSMWPETDLCVGRPLFCGFK